MFLIFAFAQLRAENFKKLTSKVLGNTPDDTSCLHKSSNGQINLKVSFQSKYVPVNLRMRTRTLLCQTASKYNQIQFDLTKRCQNCLISSNLKFMPGGPP